MRRKESLNQFDVYPRNTQSVYYVPIIGRGNPPNKVGSISYVAFENLDDLESAFPRGG